MYFIYQKQINVASEYSYNVDSIIEWFKDYIDQDDIIEAYGGDENDNIDEIIEGIQDNIENYIEELIKEASPYNYSNGDIDAEDITELVTEDEFLEKFKEWYLND